MPRLTIPKRYYTGFEAFMNLDEDEAKELFTALSNVSPSLLPERLADEVVASVHTIPSKAVNLIIQMLFSLFYLLGERRSVDQLVDDLDQAIRRSTELKKPEGMEPEVIKSRLNQFLSIDGGLQISSKARAVLNDNERTFCNARIITDIRPVFGTELDTTPSAAVIVHMLKIGYHENTEHKDFYVALDTGDVRQLEDILERANKKAKSLKVFLNKTDAYYLDVE